MNMEFSTENYAKLFCYDLLLYKYRQNRNVSMNRNHLLSAVCI